ncbi:uncharacterized protein UTRI_06321 [Ustilago trichophora]|uniref:Store-operated calcium entry-associated regulatory factor n=1 Tax=Ustilago trichophora TaxID=86804 RepID=A0A5C3ELJ5_9BASI|nr:uncharacterized protein UTRI_06321 [Ustilago trichophora]
MLATERPRAVLATLILTLVSLLPATYAYNPNSQYYGAGRRVAMSSLSTLTFYSGQRTTYRRTKPLPQLTCVGSPCSRYQPDVVQCQAMGDGQWKCSADLPSTMRMGRVEVSCEGYDYAEDPYVLKGSCALEYRLLPSGVGPDDPWRRYDGSRQGWMERAVEGLFKVIFLGVLGVIVYSFIKAITGAGGRTAGGGGGGGGWGGGGGGWWPGGPYGNNPPPPPYAPKSEQDSSSSSSSSSSSWRPGFWTGLGLGGLAATAASRNSRRQQGFYPPSQTGFFGDQGLGYGFDTGPSFRGPSRGFGGGGRGWDHDHDRGVGSSSFRESTGFGGTRNR